MGSNDIESAPLSQRVRSNVETTRVRYLYQNAPKAVPINVINSTILMIVFWSQTDHALLLAWWGAVLVLTILRLLHARSVMHHHAVESGAIRAEHQFMAGTFLTGCAWGVGYSLIGAPASQTYQLLFLLVLAGMASGAFISIGTSNRAYMLYVLPVMVPGALFSLIERSTVSLAAGIMISLFIVVLIVTHKAASAMLIDGIRLKFEKEDLVKDLSDSNQELQDANQQLEGAKESLRVISLTDELTNLPNRRHFTQVSRQVWAHARRQKQLLACLMVDIDYFKDYNDHYGHQQGDICLQAVGDVLRRSTSREDDFVARYGGEEFIVLLPDTDQPGAVIVAERIIRLLAKANLAHLASPPEVATVTVSIGVAIGKPFLYRDMDDLIKVADKALYKAKNTGRNRLVVANTVTEAASQSG